jgi:predicted dehydrogenase
MLEINRRDFLKVAGAGAAAFSLAGCVSSDLLSAYPDTGRRGRIVTGRKLNIAAVGCGGKGSSDIKSVSHENIVALCDVDSRRAEKTMAAFPDAKKYADFRVMLDEMDDDIDAVTVTTPDHMHFPIAMEAIRRGKHVFVQKPLAHTVEEARIMTLAARRHQVITQMGNQGHAGEGNRLVQEWINAGVLGEVREVHAWTNRPIWPQGMAEALPAEPVPDTMNWDLWLGVAPTRPYNSQYAPFKWRGWWDFGCGALGDMGCHILDAPYTALNLGYAESVMAESEGLTDQCAPLKSKVVFTFGARGSMPPVKVTWYDGGLKPDHPEDLEPQRKLADNGILIVGSKATLMDTSSYCNSPRLIPESKMKAFMPNAPAKTLPRVPDGDAHKEWTSACKGEGPMPGSNFDQSGPFSEMVLMGNLAVRLSGKTIKWDGENMVCSNVPEANILARKSYRSF